jgi:glycine/D-amino acid oxidase-like deaminating enzyme
MKIGIIGAGMIGATLARRLTALGHEVVIANSRGPGRGFCFPIARRLSDNGMHPDPSGAALKLNLSGG